MSDRRVAAAVTVVGGTAFVVLAVLLVPWSPVPGGTPGPVPAGGVFTAAQIARAEDYALWARVWSWSSLAVSLVVTCWLGFSRWGPRLVRRLPGWWWVRVALAVLAVSLLGRLATLPLSVMLRRHARANGLTAQGWDGFAADVLRGFAVSTVALALLALVLVGCARRWPRAWPAVAGGLLGALVLLGSFVYPVLVEPLFNNFEPLPDGPLRAGVLELAEREGVPVDQVLVADASRRTTTLNAYVSGFGGTRRVVLYDNLVDGVPRSQALSVVAHELAHARHDDVLVGSALGAAGAVFGVGLLGLVVGGLSRRGRPTMQQPEVVPLLLALLALGTFLAAPVQNGISRQVETRADVDALRASRDPGSFMAVQRQLALRSLNDPDPPWLSQLWFGSHPPTLLRIAIAEQMGDALRDEAQDR